MSHLLVYNKYGNRAVLSSYLHCPSLLVSTRRQVAFISFMHWAIPTMRIGAAILRGIPDICICFAILSLWFKRYTKNKHDIPEPTPALAQGQYSTLGSLCHSCIVISRQVRSKGYIGADFPDAWPIEVARVIMPSEETVHFDLTSPKGAIEWSALVPGSGLLYLGQHRAPFTLSMFHQLQCLDIVRQAVHEPTLNARQGADGALIGHCMNYLRQMALCRGDLALEYAESPEQVDEYGLYYCRDWSVVYEMAKENQRGM